MNKLSWCLSFATVYNHPGLSQAFTAVPTNTKGAWCLVPRPALSGEYVENDLVAVLVPPRLLVVESSTTAEEHVQEKQQPQSRLVVVRPDLTVAPLCRHEDDVETDLFLDPRTADDGFWQEVGNEDVQSTYGEGWYGQRPVPS